LHVDPSIERVTKHKPVQTVMERYIQLQCLDCIETIFPYELERDVENYLASANVHKRFLGSDYESNASITGLEVCNKRLIETVLIDRCHDWSTSELRTRAFNNELLTREVSK